MKPTTPASSEANTHDDRAAHNGDRRRQTAAQDDPAYPNTANERNGAGSPYGGTQSPDASAPDGNQTPKATENTSPDETRPAGDLGSEYADRTSYGDGPDATGTQPEGTATDDAAGTPIR